MITRVLYDELVEQFNGCKNREELKDFAIVINKVAGFKVVDRRWSAINMSAAIAAWLDVELESLEESIAESVESEIFARRLSSQFGAQEKAVIAEVVNRAESIGLTVFQVIGAVVKGDTTTLFWYGDCGEVCSCSYARDWVKARAQEEKARLAIAA